MSKVFLHIDSLPARGEVLNMGEYVITTLHDYDLCTIRNIELIMERDELLSSAARNKSAIEQAVKFRGERDAALYDLRVERTRTVKAEKESANYLKVNKSRSERVTKLMKQVSKLEGLVKSKGKQLDDAIDKNRRGHVDPKNLTINLDNQLVIQLNKGQIHIHDPARCCVVSSQLLSSEVDFVPRFIGKMYPAILDQHDNLRERIEQSINQLAVSHRKRVGKLLTADLRGETTPSVRRTLWEAGVMFISDLNNPNTIGKVKSLRGIGVKTFDRIMKAKAVLEK